ncbi:unnamed protein product [Sphenostylis stenocarpa]|uniref:Cation/H+ exchanger transmembrane domain-containing protein n=1 Tax=Sphenostylis stenocarpa TaxID=92480 RepID=A0AA86SB08_9FABA|nr:unnamed protein product [Sphenostylis stenocarpa]
MEGNNPISPADGGVDVTGGSKEQQAAGVGILLQIMMLVLSFVLGHVLRRKRIYILPEASASLLIGLLVGGLANISHTQTSIRSCLASASRLYLGGLMYLMYRLPFVECLMFGALISATDPVTVLSIFQELGTDVNLYALVFGESVLNDAMAISLYRYMLAEGLGLSGIVSILFTGMVMKHYTFSNLSRSSQRFVSAFFELISSLAETFVFIYMGFDIAMEKHSWSHAGFIFIGIARAANVFSCAYLVNLVRPAYRQIPPKHQKALWYSGLRGAMAFALALQSIHDLPEGHGRTILTATTAIVVLTVLLIGGSTGAMLEALQVVGSDSPIESPLASVTRTNFQGNNGYLSPDDEESSAGNKIKMKLQEFQRSAASFTALDRNYLTPFFTSQNEDDEDEAMPLTLKNMGLDDHDHHSS